MTRADIDALRDDLAGALTISAALVRPLVEHALSEQSRIDAAARKRVAELLAENARLREGLDFYAKIEHYLDFDNGWPGCAIYEDRGRLARALLAGSPTP